MKKWELRDKITGLEVNLNFKDAKIVELKNEIYTGEISYGYELWNKPGEHTKETWKQRADRHLREVQDLREERKTVEEKFENEVDKFNTLDKKYNKALNEIKTLKGLKEWRVECVASSQQYRRAIEAKTYKEDGEYTIFLIGKDEVYRVKTQLIESISRWG